MHQYSKFQGFIFSKGKIQFQDQHYTEKGFIVIQTSSHSVYKLLPILSH